MNKTKIEWTNQTWNPVTGCLKGCAYCYARKIAFRFYGDFQPRFFPERLGQPLELKVPSKIFVCSMGEMFGDWVPAAWQKQILNVITDASWHIFQILTKQPQNLAKYSYPENLWLGLSVDKQDAVDGLRQLLATDARVKFASFEPLLEEINTNLDGLHWIIIGAQTNPDKQPEEKWVKNLVVEAERCNIPVFMKKNLKFEPKRQEFPFLVQAYIQDKLESPGVAQTHLLF